MKKSLTVFFLFLLFTVLAETAWSQGIERDEIAFRNGDQLLTGTLVLPQNARNVPVVLFLGGINAWGDFHYNRESFISENLEAIFPASGVAVMYYNPRGLDGSGGKWQRTDFQEFADDAKAAVEYLQLRREIDATKIGIIGHGEDAWVAQMVASQIPDQVRFLVSLAGAPFEATRQLINEYHSAYVCEGQDSTSALDKAAQKAQSHENWVSFFPITKRWRHMKMKQDFDPSATLRNIRIPALFMFGKNDSDVYASWAEDGFRDIFGNSLPSNFTVEMIPGANHYFKVADRCYSNGESSVTRNYSFRFREVLRNWVFSHFQN